MPRPVARPPDASSVPDMIRDLNRAVGSIVDTAFDYPTGRVWVVSGTNGENRIVVVGRTGVEA